MQILSTRITAISAFKVKIELGRLSAASTLSTKLEGLGKITANESQIMAIASDFTKSGTADYVTIDIGQESDEWLTSRLFLLSALLERGRAVRSMVFLQAGRFIGAATPRDVRSALAMFFFEYEASLAFSYGILGNGDPADNFRGGLSKAAVQQLATGFLNNPRVICSPGPPPITNGWVYLAPNWEFANWITPSGLTEMIGYRLVTSAVIADVGPADSKTIRSIVTQPGAYIALTKTDGTFLHLCDRTALLASIAHEVLEPNDVKAALADKV
jgi:hypothetical protein